jgi:hypothetical protein
MVSSTESDENFRTASSNKIRGRRSPVAIETFWKKVQEQVQTPANFDDFDTMPRDLEPSLNTRNFTLAALQNDLRLDQRPLTHTRPLALCFGDQPGNALVQLGKTKSPPITLLSAID